MQNTHQHSEPTEIRHKIQFLILIKNQLLKNVNAKHKPKKQNKIAQFKIKSYLLRHSRLGLTQKEMFFLVLKTQLNKKIGGKKNGRLKSSYSNFYANKLNWSDFGKLQQKLYMENSKTRNATFAQLKIKFTTINLKTIR